MIEFALIVRILMHLATALAVMSYVSHRRTRPGSTLIGIAIAGASVAGALSAVQHFEQLTRQFDLWLFILVCAVAISTVLNGGNVSRLFRRPHGR